VVARAGATEDEPRAPAALDAVWDPGPLPSTIARICYTASSLLRHPEAVRDAVARGLDVVVELTGRNRRLGAAGERPPPAVFGAPRTPLNGTLSGERRYASLSVPLDDLDLVRRELDPSGSATVNDVILCAVGGALRRYLDQRGHLPADDLVALVPVSTGGRARVPGDGETPDLGNRVSGMLVALGTSVADPVERLAAVAKASEVAKGQERVAGGDLLEGLTRSLPPLLVSTAVRGISAIRLFDRMRPPFNVVVSSVAVPDVALWWAGCPVAAVHPAGPVAHGVGLNVTSMTYRGTVHFGLLACPRLVPSVEEMARLLDDAVAELVVAALDAAADSDGAPG
jgi:WS/DGAT/MGAT family acyltransferase